VEASLKQGTTVVTYRPETVTTDQIAEAIKSLGNEAELQAGNCACEVRNPAGKCCLGEVHAPEIEEAAELFTLASNSTRLKILFLLDDLKELCD